MLFSFENLAFNIEHNITVHVALTTIQLCIEMIKDSDRQHSVSALILIAYQSDWQRLKRVCVCVCVCVFCINNNKKKNLIWIYIEPNIIYEAKMN